jgi:hypothetical protein
MSISGGSVRRGIERFLDIADVDPQAKVAGRLHVPRPFLALRQAAACQSVDGLADSDALLPLHAAHCRCDILAQRHRRPHGVNASISDATSVASVMRALVEGWIPRIWLYPPAAAAMNRFVPFPVATLASS